MQPFKTWYIHSATGVTSPEIVLKASYTWVFRKCWIKMNGRPLVVLMDKGLFSVRSGWIQSCLGRTKAGWIKAGQVAMDTQATMKESPLAGRAREQMSSRPQAQTTEAAARKITQSPFVLFRFCQVSLEIFPSSWRTKQNKMAKNISARARTLFMNIEWRRKQVFALDLTFFHCFFSPSNILCLPLSQQPERDDQFFFLDNRI